ncbi:4-hydroxy-3-methylbut-2-en-1-yl diphosphate synthase [Candidatus Desantisbacteria bacterium CG2_30_40_21]|uniref:4-hydroxy-3-methylbut-2-en-1-yl diphosphate synthase (flavodoxin) n=1 Tax=Candidatus Desantisbacteria bacterium CG2_30_40_21 TaxID=1817895 RepID=A0A1J5DZJ2_9BACT|nr:MAG: 4-hydroxy-3-methylbut-2-en-1-yl diphosphate synthase [Candidatus Desantisbacteria bacterium CG2_30_40_21]
MCIPRRDSMSVKVGNLIIGGNQPISVQSMTKTDTRDVPATVYQIKQLEDAGCSIVRVAVPDISAAKCLGQIRSQINIPLVADIHFDYRLAIEAIHQGVDKLRLNPGNIKDTEKVSLICYEAKKFNIPIRIGVNSGSVDRKRFHEITPQALVDSAMEHIRLLEECDFTDIIVSLKASNIPLTIESYKLMSGMVTYPFHIGITEAGPIRTGSIRSGVGIGILLSMGLGDTVRVSLTADPVEEVYTAYEILQSLNLRRHGVQLVSCPTCGRTEVDLQKIVYSLEDKLRIIKKPLCVAVMGCVVNGPGEASEADIGVACGKGVGLLFKKGMPLYKVPQERIVDVLMEEIEKM